LRPALSLLALLFLFFPVTARAQTTPDELVVMTFNIRYGTAEDGEHVWVNRREFVGELIARHRPHVLAIQEGLAFQLADLAPYLDGYRKLGQHRDGGEGGEFSGLYVREEAVRILRWGEFWLSATPDSVGSVGWDAALPRMAVWVEVERGEGGGVWRVYGTHFDHRGREARRESAGLIANHARGGPPSIVMGDLNAPEGSDPLSLFLDEGFRSAFTHLHPHSPMGTFNGFRDPTGGDRIDHILLDRRLEPVHAEILDDVVEGLFPSDHFPVVARVRPRTPVKSGDSQ
jgi:endonuclease/exonuclease/phosphatase family metal-dependent hydrolase